MQEGGALSEIRGVRNTDSNSLLYFDTEIAGTTSTRVVIDESGHFRPYTDSTYDLGINGTRWRRVFADTYFGNGNLGILTATNIDLNGDLDVDGHTNLDNVSIAGVTTIASNTTIGGNLTVNGTNTILNTTTYVKGGEGADGILAIYADEGDDPADLWRLKSGTDGTFKLDNYAGGAWETNIKAVGNGAVELYHNNVKKIETYSGGVSVSGSIVATGGITANQNITIENIFPQLFLVDTNNNSDFAVQNLNGTFVVNDTTNSANRFTINSSGDATFANNVSIAGDVLFDSTSGSDYDMQWTTANGQLRIKDDGKLVFGTSGDVSVYHNDTDFYLWNTKGNSYIQNTGDVYIRTNNSENAIKAIQNGAVELYHNNVKTFETTNEGVTFDTNSSSCVVRLTSNTDAVSVLQAFNSDFLIKAPSGGGINLVTNASNDSLIITSGGDINIGSVGRFDASGLVKTAHGSESAPSHSFLNDPDNGMYRPTTNTLGLVTGGTEKLRITSDGKIGMKTASPQKDLHVYNSSVATVRIETGDSRGQAWDILSTNGAQNNTGTISIRDESGSSYIDFGANGGDPRLVAQLGGGSNLLYLDKHGNTNLAGICTATAFRGEIYPTIYAGGRRNMFINGEFMIAQRGDRDPMANQNNGANGLGYGGPDHVNFVTNLGAFEAKQANENNSPRSQAGATYSYELDCTSASGPSTSNYTFLNFQWSGVEANRLLYGTSNARPVTISFWVQCNKTGNFTATLRNETANKLISSVVTISSSNTWEYKTITFVGDTAAQIAVTLNARWSLELWLDGGSNYTGGTVRTGWTTRDNADRGAGSTLNICSSTSNYFRISLFQVEMGRYATPFEFRTYTEYLKDCEYYFQKPHNNPFAIHIWGHKVADTYALRSQTLLRPTEMRINPTNYYHDNNPSGLTAGRYQTQGADYEYTYNVYMGLGSNKREYTNGTRYPYGVNGMGAGESGILWAFDYESSAEF